MLLFLAAGFAATAWIAVILEWTALWRTTLGLLPLSLLLALGYLIEFEHLFEGAGTLAWIAAAAAHVWILRCHRNHTRQASELWHGAGFVFFAALLAYEVYWQLEQVVDNAVWSVSPSLIVLLGLALAVLALRDRVTWPIADYLRAYFAAALVLFTVYLVIVFGISVDGPGDPSPLAYIPVLNPFDVLTIAGLATGWYLLRIAHHENRWLMDESHRGSLIGWGVAAFVFSTIAVVRAVHHIGGVAWDDHALFDSVAVQSTLSIYWAALGLTGMILGTRRANRTIWLIGVVLMGIVVAKLFVVDLGNTGTVARIISFLGVGVMLLVVGYFSPVPPRRAEPGQGKDA